VFRSDGTHENSMHARLAFLNCLHCRCFIFNLSGPRPISMCSQVCEWKIQRAGKRFNTCLVYNLAAGANDIQFSQPSGDQKAKLVSHPIFFESASRIKSKLNESSERQSRRGLQGDFGGERWMEGASGKSRAGETSVQSLRVFNSDVNSSRDKSTCYASAVCG